MTEIEKIEAKMNWRYRWLEQVFLLSHSEYQKVQWLAPELNKEIGWVGEELCDYFDDLYLDDHYEYHIKEGNLSTEELQIIKSFHYKLSQFVEKNNQLDDVFDENDILNNPDWIEICSTGREAWSELKKTISEPEELDHMNKLEINYIR
jgi:hypothetical protein